MDDMCCTGPGGDDDFQSLRAHRGGGYGFRQQGDAQSINSGLQLHTQVIAYETWLMADKQFFT
ncbi:hypothetical protein D3C81_1763750 [compost metagenome]